MKNTTPLVSIIIPNYNRAAYLQEALKSIRNQSYTHWEAIVIDDGSTDASKEIVTKLANKDTRIKWIERKRIPKGAATCRNIGIDQASGEYLIFLDSDDLLDFHCLAQRLKVMRENSKLDFAVFKMQFFKENPGDDSRLWNIENETPTLQRFLKLDSVWQTSGPIWKTSAVKKIGGFNEKLYCWQDFDIHLKALFANLNYSIRYDLPIDCYYRRDAKDTISQTNMNTLPKLKSKIELYNWAKPLAQKNMLSVHPLLLDILVSALNGHQIQFFQKWFKAEYNVLDARVKNKLNLLKWIKITRLDRIRMVDKLYQQIIKSFLTESLIGEFVEEKLNTTIEFQK